MLELLGIGGIVGIAIVVSLVFLVMLVASRYKTVSPDEAMIITGAALGSKNVLTDESARKVKLGRGGGAFFVPIVQQRGHLRRTRRRRARGHRSRRDLHRHRRGRGHCRLRHRLHRW